MDSLPKDDDGDITVYDTFLDARKKLQPLCGCGKPSTSCPECDECPSSTSSELVNPKK